MRRQRRESDIVQVYDTPVGQGIDEAADCASQQGAPLFFFNGRIFEVDKHADYWEVGKIQRGRHSSALSPARTKPAAPAASRSELAKVAELMGMGWDANGSPTER